MKKKELQRLAYRQEHDYGKGIRLHARAYTDWLLDSELRASSLSPLLPLMSYLGFSSMYKSFLIRTPSSCSQLVIDLFRDGNSGVSVSLLN
jgi:hypothetical protein